MAWEFKKKEKKKYLVLGLIYIAVIVFVLYLASWYNTYRAYQDDIPVLRNTISQITTEEIDHFLLENPSSILYLCVAKDKECRSFEESFKRKIMENAWQTAITYIDLNHISEKETFINQLIKKYGSSVTVEKTPVFLAFEDGKLLSVAAGTMGDTLTVSEAVMFMETYKTGE